MSDKSANNISNSSNASGASSSDPIPSVQCLQHCVRIAVSDDKPIMMDYWISSHNKSVLIGVRANNEKLLVKSEEEYTSPIEKIYKVGEEYIIATENSLYIVSSSITTKRIT